MDGRAFKDAFAAIFIIGALAGLALAGVCAAVWWVVT